MKPVSFHASADMRQSMQDYRDAVARLEAAEELPAVEVELWTGRKVRAALGLAECLDGLDPESLR